MREEVPFGEFLLGDFLVNVEKNRIWKQSTEAFRMQGRFLSLHIHTCRVKPRERINSLEEKSVIHYCELRRDML